MKCKICGEASARAFGGTVLEKHRIDYFRCPACGFVQTEQPYWLEEAYSSAISDLDLGPVNRAVTGARMVEGLILAGFDPHASFIDWGGGYGLFTRLMRDNGYDFHWQDRYCQNLFAKQFAAAAGVRHELLTAFEVFEHLVEPMDEIADMARHARSLFFTTLTPPERSDLAGWWYLTPEHGQHVAFYTRRALETLARRLGLHLCTDGGDKHMLSAAPFPQGEFRRIVRDGRYAQVARRVRRRRLRTPSLLMSDFRAVTGWDV